MTDTISILSEIRSNYNCMKESEEPYYRALSEAIEAVKAEPLTDKEQRIFLAAMGREEKICKQIDDEYKEPYQDSLVSVCHKIIRKVKGALWT